MRCFSLLCAHENLLFCWSSTCSGVKTAVICLCNTICSVVTTTGNALGKNTVQMLKKTTRDAKARDGETERERERERAPLRWARSAGSVWRPCPGGLHAHCCATTCRRTPHRSPCPPPLHRCWLGGGGGDRGGGGIEEVSAPSTTIPWLHTCACMFTYM